MSPFSFTALTVFRVFDCEAWLLRLPLLIHLYHDLEFFMRSSISERRSGRGAPKVSGRKNTKKPLSRERPPKMSSGTNGGRSPMMGGATMPPMRAMKEQVPTTDGRMAVGYSSAVYKYRIENEAEAPNLPIEKKIMHILNYCTVCSILYPGV